MKVVLASKNAHKLQELQDILSAQGVEVILESAAGVDVEVEETGTTFEENSLLKARAVMEASGLPAIADDSGLMVDALNGAPGVYSARYGGPGLDDAGRYRLLLENMRGVLDRKCRFVSAITLCMPSGDIVTARGECPGTLAYAPQGENGFGYDPIFFVPEKKKTFAQLTAEEKNAISHRGRALQLFQEKLSAYLAGQKEQSNRIYGVYMELTSKQRAQLRGMANSLDPIVHIGQDGLGDNLVKQASDALEARELIKCRVLENSMLTAREAAEDLAKATRSEVVQVIGTKFVLYRQSHNKDKKDRIVLVKDKRQS